MKHTPLKKILVLGGLAFALLACGQRGPLTLPKPPEPQPKPAGYEPAPAQPTQTK